jgi:AcrR family transcriptional regulator
MQQPAGTRTYDSPLRREQAQGTRERILDAAASVITEAGDFVVAQVAERAGVSVRTVYHHFSDREAMLDALAEWLAAQLGYPRQELPEDLSAFADETVAMFKRFDADLEKMRVFFSTPIGRATRQHARARRLEHLRRLAEAELSGVDPQTAERAVVMIHQIASSRTWLALKDEADLDGSDAAETIGWAIRTLLGSLEGTPSPRGDARGGREP